MPKPTSNFPEIDPSSPAENVDQAPLVEAVKLTFMIYPASSAKAMVICGCCFRNGGGI
jgi:hypothetical protein